MSEFSPPTRSRQEVATHVVHIPDVEDFSAQRTRCAADSCRAFVLHHVGQIYRGAVTREIGAKENKRTVRQFFEVTKVISKGGAFLLTPEVRVCVLWTSPDLSPHLSPDSLSARSTHPSSELARTRKADPRIQTLAGGQPFRPRSTVTTKSCTLVSMVRAEREPRLPSLVVTNSDISTQ